MQGPDAGYPIIAEKAVQDTREIEARDDEAPQVGDQGDMCGKVGL